MPRYSLIIPTHNRAGWLSAAVDSVLSQAHGDFELIVVDDGSTDNTEAVLAAYAADPRVRCVRQANAGRSEARNQGARLAQGEWLGFLDSDDRYRPAALSEFAQVIDRQPALGLALGGYEYVDEAGQRLGERRPWEEAPLTLPNWLFNCLGIPSAILVQRTWFTQVGGFDRNCEIAEDWDIFLRLAQAGCPMDWVTAIVCEYRQHAGNSTTALDQHCRGSQRALDKLFAQPALPADVHAEAARARAWVHVDFARRACLAGDDPRARQHLEQVVRLYPPFSGRRRAEVLEALLALPGHLPVRWDILAATVSLALPPALGASNADLRRARARVEMAQFFKMVRSGNGRAARPHLAAGLRLDARWLANRGVLAYLARHLRREQPSKHAV